MQTPRGLSALAMLLALTACQTRPAGEAQFGGAVTTTAEDLAEVRATIEAAEKQWSAAYLAGDAAGIANLYAENAASIPAAGEWNRGRAGIAKDMQAQFDTVTVTAREDITEEVILAGDHAFEVGHYSWTGTSKKSGAALSGKGRYVVLWRKGADGTWRIYRDMGTEASAGS